jgi:transformation/transcription domain-associated protein
MKDANDTSDTSSVPSQAVATTTAPENQSPMIGAFPGAVPETMTSQPRQAWEDVDEILQTLKTTFLLLILSLETMVDQIQHKFKPTQEEDVYRQVSLLLSDAVHVRPAL